MFKDKPSAVQIAFISRYGFIKPYLDGTNLVLRYRTRIPVSTTVKQINDLYKNPNQYSISVFLSLELLIELSKLVLYNKEILSILPIVKYTSEGVAILGINSKYYKSASDDDKYSVSAEFVRNQFFQFHTHPDKSRFELDSYTAWPSGKDFAGVLDYYIKGYPNIAHFVATSTGVWIISITVEFQQICKTIKSFSMDKCNSEICDVIAYEFGEKEKFRKSDIEPIMRHEMVNSFSDFASSLRLVDLPKTLKNNCHIINGQENVTMFNCYILPWEDIQNGVLLSFDYIRDDMVGLLPFIEPAA
jgi:hypothetical protein